MDFRNILRRTDTDAIAEFLLTGIETIEDKPHQSFSQRILDADKKIIELIEGKIKDEIELDNFYDALSKQIGKLERTYFEAGMLLGSQAASKAEQKLKELV